MFSQTRFINFVFVVLIMPGVASAAKVKLQADRQGVSLEKHLGGAPKDAKSWEHLCFSPCEFELDLPVSLRVTGQNLYPSLPFTLSGQSAAFNLNAETVSRQDRTMYAVLGVGGGVLAANGLGLILSSILINSLEDVANEDPDLGDTSKVMLISGGIALGVGAVLGLFGLQGLLKTTTVTID